MRLAIVHEYFCNLGGADTVARVLHEMFPDAPLYTLQVYDRNRNHPWLRGMDLRTSFIQRLPLAGRTHQIFLPLMPRAIESFDFREYDMILSSSNLIAKGLIAPPGVPHVSYTHTRQHVAWDLQSEYVNMVPRPARFLAAWYMKRLRVWDVRAAQRVTQYIANSHFVAQRLQELYQRDAVVIPPPVDTETFGLSETERGDYYITIGRLVKSKRFDLAVEACKQLDMPLRVIGDGPERAELEKIAGARTEFLGVLSHAEIREQMAGARALLFPGLEAFGIVPVEAQATGLPVIAYGAGGALDTVRDGETGVLFGELDAASLIGAMLRAEKINFDARVLRAHALGFSTEQFRARLCAQLESVLQGV